VAATREVDAIVIDSLPALVPNEEDDNDTGDWSVGLAARLNNQFFRKQGTATKRSLVAVERPVTGFIINQWREKIGVMRGDPRVAPGGRQKDYEYYTRVEVRRDDWIKVDDEPVGQVTKIRVWKNKSHRPQRTAVFDMYFAEGAEGHPAGRIDHIKEVVDIGIAYDIIRQGGGGMFYIGDRSWKGRAAVAESLRSEDDLRELVVRDVMAINAHYTELVSPPPAKKAVKAVKATKKSA
jgi:recombination protein RecA